MAYAKGISLVEHFEDLEDPRVERTKFHQLRDIIVIAICAVICGADNWVEIEEWTGQTGLAGSAAGHGIPSHDTFGRVFARLDAEKFEACFVKWVQHLLQLLAIDGKTVRRSHDRRQKKEPLHLVSAWAQSRLVLGQTEVAADANEITAIPELLDMLQLSGCRSMRSAVRKRLRTRSQSAALTTFWRSNRISHSCMKLLRQCSRWRKKTC